MARPLRFDFPGAVHHVTTRGNAQAPIFLDDTDRNVLLRVLQDVIGQWHWRCHGYCLMDNHYHLLIETPEGNLSVGMRQLNGVYTQRFNRRHQRVGHLFQGRFKAILVERDSHLLELARYVVLNPVRAGIVAEASLYPWSSCAATLGIATRPPWLTVQWILGQFGRNAAESRRRYAAFVADGVGAASPWKKLRGQVVLGSAAFAEQMRSRVGTEETLHESSARSVARAPTGACRAVRRSGTHRQGRPGCRHHARPPRIRLLARRDRARRGDSLLDRQSSDQGGAVATAAMPDIKTSMGTDLVWHLPHWARAGYGVTPLRAMAG